MATFQSFDFTGKKYIFKLELEQMVFINSIKFLGLHQTILNLLGGEKFTDEVTRAQAFNFNVKCKEARDICRQLGGNMANITKENNDQMLAKFHNEDNFRAVCKNMIWTSVISSNVVIQQILNEPGTLGARNWIPWNQ